MRELIQMILTHWYIILEYVMTAFMYFLVFLYTGKTKGINLNLRTFVKEKMLAVTNTDKALRDDVDRHLKDSIARYDAARKKIEVLEKEVDRLHRAIDILTGGYYEEGGSNTTDE